ncbi:MAG: hypothetical protein L0Y38_03115, partial [Methylococcaceae bacterium]|nr:hypothetical protein [Methylococcaceae bacterium]
VQIFLARRVLLRESSWKILLETQGALSMIETGLKKRMNSTSRYSILCSAGRQAPFGGFTAKVTVRRAFLG